MSCFCLLLCLLLWLLVSVSFCILSCSCTRVSQLRLCVYVEPLRCTFWLFPGLNIMIQLTRLIISVSTLSCYSALSSRILTTNHLIAFLMLHSRYPVLQSINTYYSLIGAVYVFRLCALFSPRISSPPYYLHVFPISRNCLAPPHFPESQHRAFIPQCIYSPH